MHQTLTEKIFSKHTGRKVYAGEFVLSKVDLVMAHDTTCAWAIDPFYEIAKKVWDKTKIFIPFDHAYPAPSIQMAALQAKIRKFAELQGIPITVDGVCHQILAERYIKPGQLIFGADSHTPTGGALGALTIGSGSTDIAIAFATGKCWFKVPQTIRININGKLQKGVFAKDIILTLAKKFGVEGGNYRVFEFGGEVVRGFDISSRLTLTNMSAEMGVKAAVVEADNKTLKYLKENNRTFTLNKNELKSDPYARYEKVYNFDISNIEPVLAQPPDIDNVEAAFKLETKKIKVNQVFIGSCTNCRIEDLEQVFKIWKGKPSDGGLNPETRTIITPASKKVYLQAMARGYIEFFAKMGAIVTNPGCGACLGRNAGVLYDHEVCVSTSNRNFTGRMGSPKALIYLASPATAAATSITGYITDPRRYL